MASREKILYLGNQLSNDPNATVTTIDTLSQKLREEGFWVVMASSQKNKVVRFFHLLGTLLKHARTVRYVLIDTYSTQNFWYAVAIGNLCRMLKRPYIPILHGGNLPVRLAKSPFQSKKLFWGAKVNVAPSQYLMEAFKREGYSNLVHIPNTIELKDYAFLEREYITPKLLWVRSFTTIYNPMLALRVLERLKEIYPIVELCMVGPDKDGSLAQCKRYASTKNLPVTFTGKLSKKEWIELSKEYDVFINTTHFDNTPISVMEAMALGLPIVSTLVGGIPYLLQNKKDALCVPPNDVETFVEAIILLHQTPSMAKNLARQARKKVENFDWQKVKELWLPLLQD